MTFESAKHNGIYTAAEGKYIYTLINIAHGKYNAYASLRGTHGINILLAENSSRAEAQRACEKYASKNR